MDECHTNSFHLCKNTIFEAKKYSYTINVCVPWCKRTELRHVCMRHQGIHIIVVTDPMDCEVCVSDKSTQGPCVCISVLCVF